MIRASLAVIALCAWLSCACAALAAPSPTLVCLQSKLVA
jgi:hypothetical protein